MWKRRQGGETIELLHRRARSRNQDDLLEQDSDLTGTLLGTLQAGGMPRRRGGLSGTISGGDQNQWGPVGTHPGTILGALAGGLLGYVPSPPMDC